MGTSADRRYGGEGAAERTARRRLELIDAALTAMADGEWRSATVARVCADAGLNKRYFYESFSDLDVLAESVIDEISSHVAAAAVEAYATVLAEPLDVQARAVVGGIVDVFGDDPRKALVLLGGAAGTQAVNARRNDALTGLTAVLVAHARIIHGVELEKDSLASTAPSFVIGGTAQAILSWVSADSGLTRHALADDITALWLTVGDGAAAVARTRLG